LQENLTKRIGRKIRELRRQRGLTQMELAERVGVSFQQIQKYEKGATRISVERLDQICKVLGVGIHLFLEGGEAPRVSEAPGAYGASSEDEEEVLLRLFRRIKNPRIRKGIIMQLEGIVQGEGRSRG